MLQANRINSKIHAKKAKATTTKLRRSPISILPDDVLHYLFTFTTDPNAASHQPTIRVTHVCRLWRRIALDSALLWNKIKYNVGPDMLRTFLERSKDALLEVDIDIRAGNWAKLSALVDILLPRIPQLKALSVACPSSGMHYFLQHISTDPSHQNDTYMHNVHATNLESLCLEISSGHVYDHDMMMGLWFGGHAPKLQHLQFTRMPNPLHQPLFMNITSLSLLGQSTRIITSIIARCPQIRELYLSSFHPPSPLTLPTLRKLTLVLPYHINHMGPASLTSQSWDGLIDLVVHNVEIKAMLEILRQTPRLERARLAESPPLPASNLPPLAVVTLNCLVFLDITWAQKSRDPDALQHLQTPALKDLRLQFGYGPRNRTQDFIHYVAKIRPPLKYLSLQQLQLTDNQLHSILTNLPFLEELSTADVQKADVKILRVFKHHPKLCLRLRALNIEPCDQYPRHHLDVFLHRRRESVGKNSLS